MHYVVNDAFNDFGVLKSGGLPACWNLRCEGGTHFESASLLEAVT